ncbi:MAG: acetyl-CoA carboxylase biotin carboxyl carrier protein [Alphaproteobacteria bacterium]|nr:acetyl-CoA carboxylase biotin carboxyl carrier protein [Alphaproteobacteria bacterium]MCD8520092.1 acetyl-CoA carboxylase biotin carboxyl carrier protein [Alphaproteobacteria bacterium]MCD8525870.1 acetyl-CoA carboxylase biotin carboxyl carrier protein [Alphaproteobacteria bacterium]MCD8570729.1 acetyl-CoA carboxylase biotin carboxyl carrier protein [Alphaproteobacteria bacterium]
MKIDSKAIKELAALLNETGLSEIEVADGDQAIRVAKGGATVVQGYTPAASPVNMNSDPTTPQPASMTSDTVAHNHPGAVTSPMVGTVYLQGEPGTPPFVKKGDTVKAGDTLVIIEAMKVMNPIKAEKGGTVTQILVSDGQPVEYADVLMVIE